MTHKPKLIDECYMVICTEADGGEGIPAIHHDGMAMPLVAADKDRLDSFRSMLPDLKEQSGGLPIKIVRFSLMEVLEEL